MAEHMITIAPHLKVLLVDPSHLYCERLAVMLRVLGFHRIAATPSVASALGFIEVDAIDLIFLADDERYVTVWRMLATSQARHVLVIGISDSANAAGRLSDATVSRHLYPSFLRETLIHLYASSAARRSKVLSIGPWLPRGAPLKSTQGQV